MVAPKLYDPAVVWPSILQEVANGASLSKALAKLDPAPSYSWAKLQLRENPDLRRAWETALEDRGDRLAEELIELADSPMPSWLEGHAMAAWATQLRLRVDVRKWSAAKLRPRVYADRLDLSVGHEQISITKVLEDAKNRVLTIDAE